MSRTLPVIAQTEQHRLQVALQCVDRMTVQLSENVNCDLQAEQRTLLDLHAQVQLSLDELDALGLVPMGEKSA